MENRTDFRNIQAASLRDNAFTASGCDLVITKFDLIVNSKMETKKDLAVFF